MEHLVNGALFGTINGTANGGQLIDGKVGHAIMFDGVDDYVDFGAQQDNCIGNPYYCLSSGMTVALWVKFHGCNETTCRIVNSGGQNVDSYGLCLNVEGEGTWNIQVRTNITSWDFSSAESVTANWIHVAFTLSGTTDLVCYLNGVVVGHTEGVPVPEPYVPDVHQFVLSTSSKRIRVGTKTTEVVLDELHIWKRILSPLEILHLFLQ